jgi:hypothetical protein
VRANAAPFSQLRENEAAMMAIAAFKSFEAPDDLKLGNKVIYCLRSLYNSAVRITIAFT